MSEFRTTLSAKDLMQLRQVLVRSYDTIGYLSEEELHHLKVSIDAAIHIDETVRFHKYLVDAMPAAELDGEALDNAWDKFYETDWLIGFGDMLIKFPNGATIYNYITEFLADYIQNEL